MATYKELKDNFIEEIAKINVGELSLGGFGNTYKDYAELLKAVSQIPNESMFDSFTGIDFSSKIKVPKKER